MNTVKLLATIVLMSFVSMNAYSQEIDTLIIDGKPFFVYPSRIEVNIQKEYWITVNDKEFFSDYNNYFNEFVGNRGFNREKFQMAKSKAAKKRLDNRLKNKWKGVRSNYYLNKPFRFRFKRKVRKDPTILLNVSYQLDKDIMPPFDPIPDGEYVQLFEDFPLIGENGKVLPQTKRIAGVFTIKDNVIEGDACWFNVQGDTMKKASYVGGIIHGDAICYKYAKYNRALSKFQVRSIKKYGHVNHRDTSYMFTQFKNGRKHGLYIRTEGLIIDSVIGYHIDGKAAGTWDYFTNGVLTDHHEYADINDTVLSKKPIIRSSANRIRLGGDGYEFVDFDSHLFRLRSIPYSYYSIPIEEEESLDLDGELERSHLIVNPESREIRGGYYEGDYSSGNGLARYIRDERMGKSLAHWKWIDSLGARMKYTGTYERYYPNGQRFFKYEFVNGELVSEDTIFWSNGVAHDVITFNSDSNQYLRTVYDFKGKEYNGLIYDSLGKFVRYTKDQTKHDFVSINGYKTELKEQDYYFKKLPKYNEYFMYSNWDTLYTELTEPTLIYQSWSMYDTTERLKTEYFPAQRKLVTTTFSVSGDTTLCMKKTFSEDFQGWIGKRYARMGSRLAVVATTSGVLKDDYTNDSIPQSLVRESYRLFNVTRDYNLMKDGEVFTGDFTVIRGKRAVKLSGGNNKLKLTLSRSGKGFRNKIERKIKKYKVRGKGEGLIVQTLKNGRYGSALKEGVNDELVVPIIRDLFGSDIANYFNISGKSYTKAIGYILNGKPEGSWKLYDNYGKVKAEASFVNGEIEGELRFYKYENKLKKRGYRYGALVPDTLPKKRVRYLAAVANFKEGVLNGAAIEYDWLGRVITELNYKAGLLDGPIFIKQATSYSIANFQEGLLDGYYKTYLTMNNIDTTLLYDLNFQHGLLNGESKSYHLNGNVSKRGFFLDGKPIEDYEAYDSLGFKYHYVKFKYGSPVEEKIWEENELSIRYKFNWEDSIEFNPRDLTSSRSLDRVMRRRGYRNEELNSKYYGRPRLINKSDVIHHMTKYYPNDTVAREGKLNDNKKIGEWKFYGYEGEFLYEANYFDTIIKVNDSIKFKAKGTLSDYDDQGNKLYTAYIIEKFEKYDCAHTDHYEIRQLYTTWENNDSTGRMNGYVYNYYDNGTLQGEGQMKNGLPVGLWKYYDPFGKLNKMGQYIMGKRNGRWLEGDLSKKKYLGEICMNPDLPNLEKEQKYQENLLDITIINYAMGKTISKQFFDVNMNRVKELKNSEFAITGTPNF